MAGLAIGSAAPELGLNVKRLPLELKRCEGGGGSLGSQ